MKFILDGTSILTGFPRSVEFEVDEEMIKDMSESERDVAIHEAAFDVASTNGLFRSSYRPIEEQENS